MGVLEKISQLKKEGVKDEDISKKMQEQGVSPGEIEDALHQLKVKKAVSADESFSQPTRKMPTNQGQFYTPRTKDIDENQMEAPTNEQTFESQDNYYVPQNQEETSMQNYPASQGTAQQEYYPQYNYDESSPYQTGYSSGANNTDTMIEIAEQVFAEKTKDMQKQLDTLSEFATLAENKIENNNERIKRIEKIIDNLQIKILEKVSSYGDNIDNVKKEMSMMQESFSKILPELEEAKKHSHKTEHKK